MAAKEEKKEKNMTDNATNVKVLLLSEIAVPYDWNSRSKDSVLVEGAGDDGSEDGGTDGISLSIEARGQDTPVHVRLNPNKRDTKHPYELIAGFKRFEALTRLAKRGLANKNNHPIAAVPLWDATKPTILATVDDVTDTGARAVNLRENMARGNLTSADTCFALADYRKLRTEELGGKELTDVTIAAEMGTTQGYVSKLRRIEEACAKAPRGNEVLSHWRIMREPLGVDRMLLVIKVDAERLQEEFLNTIGKVKAADPNAPKDPNEWMKGTCEKAEAVGRYFGIAQYHSQMEKGEEILWGEIIGDMISIKKGASPEQIKEIGKSARAGFYAGLKEIPTEKAKAEAEKVAKLEKAAAAKDAAGDKKAAKDAAAKGNGQPQAAS